MRLGTLWNLRGQETEEEGNQQKEKKKDQERVNRKLGGKQRQWDIKEKWVTNCLNCGWQS